MSPLLFSAYVPPRFDQLPQSVISGQLWHGTLVRCGPGVRGKGWPETPMVRAQALHFLMNKYPLVAVLHTAAWVWGYQWLEDIPAALSTVKAKRFLHQSPLGCRVYELNVLDDHYFEMGEVFVTTPERTIYDYLYLPQEEIREDLTAAMAFLLHRVTMKDEELVRAFHGRNRPYRSRALERLSMLHQLNATKQLT